MPGAYASLVISIKGKDHEMAEEHTEALGTSWGWGAKFHVTLLALKRSTEDQR